ncbi:hypothetical protein [Microbulbifer hainanensis]|uniref:hypothetical protein n=1 Tax=Microbulbifer hainanensis TaxID=2735675 RepID=UPI00186880AF|nr:hypothetical protein [Microbulbifer hainanensis]
MSGQEKFQVVSAGKTLRARTAEDVVREAAQTFSIPVAKARRLMLKGWVIKDQLSSKQVIEYRTRLQKIGLRVEVFPAGKYDNRELLAKLQFAQKRRNRNDVTRNAKPVEVAAEAAPAVSAGSSESSPAQPESPKRSPIANRKTDKPEPRPENGKSRAREQIEALFSDEPQQWKGVGIKRFILVLGAGAAAMVPGLFVLLAVFSIYSAVRTLWQIAQAIMSGNLGVLGIVSCMVTLLLIAFTVALLVWPFFFARRFEDGDKKGVVVLSRRDAQGLYLLLDVLAEKANLPKVSDIHVTAGAEVVAGPISFAGLRARQLPLNLGLGAVCSLPGRELAALVARALGIYRDTPRGLAARLIQGSSRRLQLMQWALENERSAVAPQGECAAPIKPLHGLLAVTGRVLMPVIDQLADIHHKLTAPVARLLERDGDACAARVLGSDDFVRFAEKWHQLVHAELVAVEINREAEVASQRLSDFPGAIRWILENLDSETRSNIELAMAQTSDPWDSAQAADNERIAWVEELTLSPLMNKAFSVQKLIDGLPALRESVSAGMSVESARAVENQRLLCASKEAEASLQVLGEYFNQLPLREVLPEAPPSADEFAEMDLQSVIDWLRGKLVDARELEQRLDQLRARSAAISLGAGLIKSQVKIEPQDYYLSGSTPAAAEESLNDNRARVGELQQQYRQIFAAFVLRVQRAVDAMSGEQGQAAREIQQQLAAYCAIAPQAEKLERYADILGLMIDSLSLDTSQRELIQKFYDMAAAGLAAAFDGADRNNSLRASGLPESLEARVGRITAYGLPQDRQGVMDALQAMEIRCKGASAAILEHYRIQLAPLLESCLKQERSMGVRPLRLVGNLR